MADVMIRGNPFVKIRNRFPRGDLSYLDPFGMAELAIREMEYQGMIVQQYLANRRDKKVEKNGR